MTVYSMNDTLLNILDIQFEVIMQSQYKFHFINHFYEKDHFVFNCIEILDVLFTRPYS